MPLILRQLLMTWLPALVGGACAILVPWYSYHKGLEHGRLEIRAKTDQQTIAVMTEQVERHKKLIDQANKASDRLLNITHQREAQNRATTETLQEMLNETSALRAACVYDAVVMRELQTARDRAADAATSGIDDTVPGSSESGE